MLESHFSEVVMSRRELYDRVWSTPFYTLAHELGVTQERLIELCRRHAIPRPKRGHWSRSVAARGRHQESLPEDEQQGASFSEIRLRQWHAVKTAEVSFDDDVRECLSLANSLPFIRVPATLRRPHPLVQAYREAARLNKLPWESRARQPASPTPPSISVSAGCEKRALRYLDTLAKAVVKVGGSLCASPNTDEPHRSETIVRLCGENVTTIRVRELFRQQPNPLGARSRYELVPTGRLVLDHGRSGFERFHSQDREESKIEDQINSTLIGWVEFLGRRRIKLRRDAEAAKLRAEREQNLRQAREQQERRQRAEQERLDRLLKEASSLQESRAIRDYVENALSSNGISLGMSEFPDRDSWARWALMQADRIDPLHPSPRSVHDQNLEEEGLAKRVVPTGDSNSSIADRASKTDPVRTLTDLGPWRNSWAP